MGEPGMEPRNPLGTGSSRRDWQAVGVASGLGCSIVVSLFLCIGAGVLLDRWLGTSPILVLAGVALGLATAGYFLYELVVLDVPDRGRFHTRKRVEAPERDPWDDAEDDSG